MHLLSLLLFLVLDPAVRGFVVVPAPTTTTTARQAAALFVAAKKGVKSKQRKPTAGGGFGGSTKEEVLVAGVESKSKNGDYSVFPALEQRVRDTLVAAAAADDDAAALTTDENSNGMTREIYQRLDQIYGFPSFNYASLSTKKAEPLMTMGDMLSTSAAASVTGAPTSPSAPSSKSVDHSSDLSRLPPFAKIRVLHVDPLVLAIDDFFTAPECDRYVAASETKTNKNILRSRSPTVGKDAEAKAQRTSTTFYHMYRQVPELISKASRLLGIDTVDRWEEPQTVRYRRNEKFTWHLDALGPVEQQESPAGQRTATLLVYLTDLQAKEGGATLFRDLGIVGGDDNIEYLRVQPVKGMALLFFPAAGGIVDCPFDIRTLHAGEIVAADAVSDKWIAQLWLRQSSYPPTVPPGNRHADAAEAVSRYCKGDSSSIH